MSWAEIKATPKVELLGLIHALSEYNVLHSFDGYTERDVNEMAKNKPEIRQQFSDYQRTKRKFHGEENKKITSFRQIM